MAFWKSCLNPIWSWPLVTIHFVYLAVGRMYNHHPFISWMILAGKPSCFFSPTHFFSLLLLDNVPNKQYNLLLYKETIQVWDQLEVGANCLISIVPAFTSALAVRIAFTMLRYKWWPGNESLSCLVASGRRRKQKTCHLMWNSLTVHRITVLVSKVHRVWIAAFTIAEKKIEQEI